MIRILAVGKIKEKSLVSLIEEYRKRLSAYCRLEIQEVQDEPAPAQNSAAQDEQVKKTEGERLLSRIREKDYVILLDLAGEMLDSLQLAKNMEQLFAQGNSDLVFVIGGSLGVSEALKKRANARWKLSDLTFPHQLVRLLVLEQIYRAYKINKNEPYHK